MYYLKKILLITFILLNSCSFNKLNNMQKSNLKQSNELNKDKLIENLDKIDNSEIIERLNNSLNDINIAKAIIKKIEGKNTILSYENIKMILDNLIKRYDKLYIGKNLKNLISQSANIKNNSYILLLKKYKNEESKILNTKDE